MTESAYSRTIVQGAADLTSGTLCKHGGSYIFEVTSGSHNYSYTYTHDQRSDDAPAMCLASKGFSCEGP